MARIAVTLIVILLGLSGVLLAIVRSKRLMQSSRPHALLDYLLLWPLIFDQLSRKNRIAAGGSFFTAGELFGAVIFLAVLILGLAFF